MNYVVALFADKPGRSDWVAGLRLAGIVAFPLAIAIIFGAPEAGLLIATGAFFALNVNFEVGGRATRLGVATSVLLAPVACAIGILLGGDGILAIALGLALLTAGGLASAAGPIATTHGVFVSLAYLIGIGLAGTDAGVFTVSLAILIGGIYAVGAAQLLRSIGTGWAFQPAPDLPPAHPPGDALRREVTGWTPTTRRALAIGVVGAVGLILVPFVQGSNGAWIIAAGLIVLAPDVRSTVDEATTRGLVNVAAVIVAGVVAAVVSSAWLLLIVAVVLACAAQAFLRRSYVSFSMFLLPLAVLVVGIVNPVGWEGVVLHGADVAIGSVVAVVAGLFLLPREKREEDVDLRESLTQSVQ